jgi:phosphoribosylanthranilate isomerase
VGVVGYASIGRVLGLAQKADLEVLQLHGNFSPDEHAQLRQEFDGQLWAVIPVEAASGAITSEWREIADASDALMLDTNVGGRSGGTGEVFNWKAAAPLVSAIAREIPLVLAGGLGPENVASAIRQLHPAVVDVSSGVEDSPGIKSHALMTAFAQAVVSASIV